MSWWGNFALGFTYLSPLVGVYSLFALALSTGGPPSIFWLGIVGTGQLLVSLVFGEVVSQYPIAGGIYPWTRRLWGKRYAWMAAWVYIWAMLVTITAVAEYGTGFLASLINAPVTNEVTLGLSALFLIVAFGINFSGTKTLARVARIGLAAELIGVVGLGLYLLIFQRKQEFSVFFDSMGVQGDGSYAAAFLGAALAGLFLFYGFEACGDVAEEVENPARRIPTAMIMTILIGGVSALFSFGGYVMAAPDLQSIVNGGNADPIPAILESSLGTVGSKLFLVVALTAFLSCVLSLQAAASRLEQGRDVRERSRPGLRTVRNVPPGPPGHIRGLPRRLDRPDRARHRNGHRAALSVHCQAAQRLACSGGRCDRDGPADPGALRHAVTGSADKGRARPWTGPSCLSPVARSAGKKKGPAEAGPSSQR